MVAPHSVHRHLVMQDYGIDPVSFTATTIKDASNDLLDEVRGVQTVEDALRLYHIAKGLRDTLDAIAVYALQKSDVLCGDDR